jgi:hypothetical protein
VLVYLRGAAALGVANICAIPRSRQRSARTGRSVLPVNPKLAFLAMGSVSLRSPAPRRFTPTWATFGRKAIGFSWLASSIPA